MLHIARGIAMNASKGCLKVLNLNHNRVGTKGVQLLCEALKDHNRLESLFLNDNAIDSDGAYSLSKLLAGSQPHSPNIKELHISHNRIAASGLSVIFDSLTKHNKKLRFLDISYNLIDIGILRSLRQTLERNTTLNYLSISGLHKFNRRAIESLTESIAMSGGIKLIDLKRTTKLFFNGIDFGVNALREQAHKPKVIFIKDSVYLSSSKNNKESTEALNYTGP